MRLGCELAVTAVFDGVRCVVRRALALPASTGDAPRPLVARRRTRSETFTASAADGVRRRPLEAVGGEGCSERVHITGRSPHRVVSSGQGDSKPAMHVAQGVPPAPPLWR